MITRIIIAMLLGLFLSTTAPKIQAQSNDNEAGWMALYKVFPKNIFPARGRIRLVPQGEPKEVLQKLESMGKEIMGTSAEPLALFYRGNLLFNLERYEDALQNNRQLKKDHPRHGLCRALIPGQLSMVDEALKDIQAEIDVRKIYKVVKLPKAELDRTGKAVFHTADGSFEISCYTLASPKTTANFKKLVKEGFYIGQCFHELLSFRRMTMGCPNTQDKDKNQDVWGQGGPGYELPLEFNDALHIGQAVSMKATANGMSHGSQFSICLHNQPELNNKQAVFGKLTGGLQVLRKMSQTRVIGGGRPIKRLEITGTEWVDR